MTQKEFNALAEKELDAIKACLIKKGGEYTFNEDRLDCFKKAGKLEQTSATKALTGFLTKHIISVYDMVSSGKAYPESLWNEKIRDIMSYMVLLKGVLIDDGLCSLEEVQPNGKSVPEAAKTRLLEQPCTYQSGKASK